jgi:hypothetical protein
MAKALKVFTDKSTEGVVSLLNVSKLATCKYEIMDTKVGKATFTLQFTIDEGIFEHIFDGNNELPVSDDENYLTVANNTSNQIAVSYNSNSCKVAGANSAKLTLIFNLADGKTPGTLGTKTPGSLPEELKK